jgi:competence protein ComEC
MNRVLRSVVLLASAVGLLSLCAFAAPAQEKDKPLQVYFIDVEGGQSTLFVTPAGESLLIDTGWPDHDNRDAKRIVAVAKQAGVSKIDYVLITHFHEDHVGGVPQLAAMIPIGTFIDHGENREVKNPDVVRFFQAYQKVLASGKYKHIVAHPGYKLPIKGIDATVVSADGKLIAKPLPGAGEKNPACDRTPPFPPDQTENVRSVGTAFTFGRLRLLDLGDLTKDGEIQLMCPVNKIGHFDIYIVSHHGWEQSGTPALVDGIHPEVAIMDNGEKKGGSPSSWEVIHDSPGLADLWQLHYSDEGGATHNVASAQIANLQGTDPGNYIKLTAWPDGKFEVFNSRTGETKTYQKR